MNKASKRYRSRESYISKDPVKRLHSLDNLSRYRKGRDKREGILRKIGFYIVCPYCKKSVVVKNYRVIESLLHFSRCEDCQHFERLPEPQDVIYDHQSIEVVAVCNDKQNYATFFTEEQLGRDNVSIVNRLDCTYSKEKREELVCCGFEEKKSLGSE